MPEDKSLQQWVCVCVCVCVCVSVCVYLCLCLSVYVLIYWEEVYRVTWGDFRTLNILYIRQETGQNKEILQELRFLVFSSRWQ